jgi:hypothetical protein
MAERSEELRDALAAIAAEDVEAVLAQARETARERARELLADELVEQLLRAAAGSKTPAPAGSPESAWWVYCVLRAEDAGAVPTALAGVEPASTVELIREGDLAALASRVPRSHYDDEHLREHLNDIAWVERTARAHEAVLDAALAQATIVPLRLCTLYREHAGVQAMLRQQAPALRESLTLVDGRTEWGLKVFADLDRLAATYAEAEPPPGSGSEYLAQRRREREQSEQASELAERAAADVNAELETAAIRARTNPLQPREVHGREADLLLNAAYLVERGREADLHEALARVDARWREAGIELEVELTGPWPPYNFVSPTTAAIT